MAKCFTTPVAIAIGMVLQLNLAIALACTAEIAPTSGPSMVNCMTTDGSLIRVIGSQCPAPLVPAARPSCTHPVS